MSSSILLAFTRAEPAPFGHTPMLVARAAAGFPSPAEDYFEEPVDLKRFLVRNGAATFLMRVEGISMEGAGIYDGDIAVLDRSIDWRSGSIVVARLNGEYVLKRIRREGKRIFLMPENLGYRPIEITPESDAEVIAVVTFTLRQHHRF